MPINERCSALRQAHTLLFVTQASILFFNELFGLQNYEGEKNEHGSMDI